MSENSSRPSVAHAVTDASRSRVGQGAAAAAEAEALLVDFLLRDARLSVRRGGRVRRFGRSDRLAKHLRGAIDTTGAVPRLADAAVQRFDGASGEDGWACGEACPPPPEA